MILSLSEVLLTEIPSLTREKIINQYMANTIEIKVFHVSERLPSVRVSVLVFTESGNKYIAARYETNPHANAPSANQIKWGLIYNNKIIGEVSAVTHWCPLNIRPALPELRSREVGIKAIMA